MRARSDRSIPWTLCLIALIGGVLLGYVVRGVGLESSQLAESGSTVEVRDDHDDHDHDDHVDVSVAAAKSLGLRIEPVRLQDYAKHLHIPAMVIEKPGQSGLTVTSPAQGIIRQIYRFPGQSLSQGDRLFTLQLTDEALESAQLSILETLTRIIVVEREIARMEPLAESGAVVGRRKLELEYELKQLLSERSARLQELRLRGLSTAQIERLIDRRELVAEIDLYLDIAEPVIRGNDMIEGDFQASRDAVYTVEQLDVFPGRAVRKGEELCHVANHHELFLRGEAFETDVPFIHRLNEQGWTISAEFGEGEQRKRVENLSMTFIDNHVDARTQTFPFYLALPNQVVSESRDAAGRLFRSWRFKPGQRAHLFVPVEKWNDEIVLPREALARSGVETFVFRLENTSDLDGHDGLDLLEPSELQRRLWDLPEFEFEPVAVHVKHQDRYQCVIDSGGSLQPGDLVAMNRAYQLFLAWKLQISGGGGHHHDHDH